MEKAEFRKLLAEIGELAKSQNRQLSVNTIDRFFEKAGLDREQMELVYAYLEAGKITVTGHETTENPFVEEDDGRPEEARAFDEEESRCTAMYVEELNTLPRPGREEEEELYRAAAGGDGLAKSRLVEANLYRVVKAAKQYEGQGVLTADLIQEGNIGLMLAVDGLKEGMEPEEALLAVRRGITEAMEVAIEENSLVKSGSREFIGKINYVNEGAENLEEELGRPATLQELAGYMEMTVEETADIIRLSDNEIKIAENIKE